MAKRDMVAAVAGVTMAVAALAGCSGDTSTPAAKITVGGQDQPVHGDVVCATHDGSTGITIGDATSGVIAMLTDSDSPEVQSVVFGDVDDAKLMYIKDMPVSGTPAETKASKNGKHYTISGTASKLETVPNPESKTFEIDVTCP